MAVPRLQEQLLGMAGRKVRARMRKIYPDLREDTELPSCPVEDLVPTDVLVGVEFASPQARTLAEDSDLTWSDFANLVLGASSDRGYTADDVREIIRLMNEES